MDDQTMYTALSILIHVVQLLTILICIQYGLDKRSIQPYRLFSIGWIIILLQDLTMAVIGFFFTPANNLWVYNIALPLQQLFSMFFFILLLNERKWMILMVLFAIFAVFNYSIWQGPVKLNTLSLALGGIIIVVLAFTKMYRLFKLDTVQNLYSEPAFWISAGFILFWCFGSSFFAMYNFLSEAFPEFFTDYFYIVNFGFLILLNLSVIKALQCSLQTKRSSVS